MPCQRIMFRRSLPQTPSGTGSPRTDVTSELFLLNTDLKNGRYQKKNSLMIQEEKSKWPSNVSVKNFDSVTNHMTYLSCCCGHSRVADTWQGRWLAPSNMCHWVLCWPSHPHTGQGQTRRPRRRLSPPRKCPTQTRQHGWQACPGPTTTRKHAKCSQYTFPTVDSFFCCCWLTLVFFLYNWDYTSPRNCQEFKSGASDSDKRFTKPQEKTGWEPILSCTDQSPSYHIIIIWHFLITQLLQLPCLYTACLLRQKKNMKKGTTKQVYSLFLSQTGWWWHGQVVKVLDSGSRSGLNYGLGSNLLPLSLCLRVVVLSASSPSDETKKTWSPMGCKLCPY